MILMFCCIIFHVFFVCVVIEEKADYVVFFCGHLYHRRCVSKKNDVSLASFLVQCHYNYKHNYCIIIFFSPFVVHVETYFSCKNMSTQ